ncbi:hypothetical protein [Massilia sp. S19_KUP03_FR1]|uniref:hypothetical protein n=1 Tax=Massilia sp. S19_KUP03_FR1 TaxID=3025503 RepID=UPI002FCDDAB0
MGSERHFLYKLRRYREGGGTFPVEGVDMVERLVDAVAAAEPFAADAGRGMAAAQTGQAAPTRFDRETQLAPIGKGFIC